MNNADKPIHPSTTKDSTEITEQYAREVAQASLEKAAEKAKTKRVLGITKRFSGSALVSRTIIDKESITNEQNITLL